MSKEEEDGVMVIEFGIEITRDGGIQGYSRGSKTILNLFGPEAQAWFDETMEKVCPLLDDIAEGFEEVFIEKTGAERAGKESAPTPTAADILSEDEANEQ